MGIIKKLDYGIKLESKDTNQQNSRGDSKEAERDRLQFSQSIQHVTDKYNFKSIGYYLNQLKNVQFPEKKISRVISRVYCYLLP